uniref:Uncharacterized protein LOC109506262 n=1 Tax=Elaeis guineensis var. tenera TaxID=51953 RepID=A0A6J0PML3_ELAGV|nr:uncharacterized protein LOC109506262 [Elaeis guineensis]
MAITFRLPAGINEFVFKRGEQRILEKADTVMEFMRPVVRDVRKLSNRDYRNCFVRTTAHVRRLQPNTTQVKLLKEGMSFFILQSRDLCLQGAKTAVHIYGHMIQNPPPALRGR